MLRALKSHSMLRGFGNSITSIQQAMTWTAVSPLILAGSDRDILVPPTLLSVLVALLGCEGPSPYRHTIFVDNHAQNARKPHIAFCLRYDWFHISPRIQF